MTTRTACWSILALTVLGLGHAVDFGPCYRPCVTGDERVCNYTFVEEMYTTMIPAACGACGQPGGEADCSLPGCVPADGVERTVYTINRLLPGPAIHVCLGDVVQVDFQNRLIGHGETLHWHGLHQRETPYMDGVSMITQCPVASGTSFQYRFSAAQPGTWFYHSHNGINKANGIEGTLVIRAPPSTSPKTELLYDEDLAEHTIFLIDWMHVDADTVFPGRHTPPVNQLPTSVLINGKGNFLDSNNTTPVEEFRVQRGRRYRFRIINSGTLSCPIVLQVVGHNMTLIAADGYDVKPQPIDTLYTYSGERYDVVLTADNDAANAFWIYAHSDELCSSATPADQVAVLRYVGDDKVDDAALPEGCTGKCRPSNKLKRGIVFNSPDCDSTSANKLCVSDLLDASPVSDKQLLGLEEATDSIVLDASFHSYTPEELFRSGTYPHFLTLDTAHVAGMLGNVTYESPSSPLLTQPGDAATCSSCEVGQDFCSCAHVIRVPLGSYYQMALVESSDNPAPSHPMHLHGYSFRVLAMGTLNSSLSGQERIQYVRDNTAQLLSSNYNSNPAAKDTVVLPKNGYVILRFKADNPGVWFFHCHYQYHMASGMEAAFQVGEAKDFQPVPPNFPKCGNYQTN